DNVRCDAISGAYASVDDVLAVAYVYQSATPPPIRIQRLSATAQPIGTPVVAVMGTEPKLASSGSHFYLVHRPTGVFPADYNVTTLTSALAVQGDAPLHTDNSLIVQAAVASGDGEAIAVWAELEPGTMISDIWMRRFCGP